MDNKIKNKLLQYQKEELKESIIYEKLAAREKNENNKNVLLKISREEKAHYDYFKKYTKCDVKPNRFKITFYYLIAVLFGLTFGIKLMENGEGDAQKNYLMIKDEIEDIEKIIKDEEEHENSLIALIKEEILNYVGSIVLGLNDALVELTGALAGFTFALQKTNLIALTGLITGIAASFSMAASEYLSNRAEGKGKTALKSSIYTGTAYIITVFLLILPFLLVKNCLFALAITLLIAILIILFFNFYISVAKNLNFKKRFLEMVVISMGVAALSFGVGYILKFFFNIEV